MYYSYVEIEYIATSFSPARTNLALKLLMNLLPLSVALAIAVDLANLSVSARKCWCRVMFGIWQCCGKSSVEPKIQYAQVLGMGDVVQVTSVVVHQWPQVPSVDTL
jgi:hypothetical protein